MTTATSEAQCPICRKHYPFSVKEHWGEYDILECPGCSLQFAHPLTFLPEQYEQFYTASRPGASPYEESYYAGIERLKLHVASRKLWTFLLAYERLALRWLCRHVAKGSGILDIGCGTGRFLFQLQRKGFVPIGLDIAAKPVELLQDLGLRYVGVGSVGKYPNDWPVPKAVTFFEVLEHLSDPLGALEGIRRQFPGASLLVSVPSPSWWALEGGRPQTDYPPHHLTRWTPGALRRALFAAGYTSVDVFTPAPTGEELAPAAKDLLFALRRLKSRGDTGGRNNGFASGGNGKGRVDLPSLSALILMGHVVYHLGARLLYWLPARRLAGRGLSTHSMLAIGQ